MCKVRIRIVWMLVILGLTGFIIGCNSIPVPEEKKSYIGTWEGVGFHLTINDNGGVDSRRIDGNRSTKISGPLKDFDGDDFIIGVLFFTTTFEVHKPPYLDGDDWLMIVDGVELKKVAGPIT